jgi:hypothetical protein
MPQLWPQSGHSDCIGVIEAVINNSYNQTVKLSMEYYFFTEPYFIFLTGDVYSFVLSFCEARMNFPPKTVDIIFCA